MKRGGSWLVGLYHEASGEASDKLDILYDGPDKKKARVAIERNVGRFPVYVFRVTKSFSFTAADLTASLSRKAF